MDLPASLRKLSQRAFAHCKSLKSARIKPGLEVLGTDQKSEDGKLVVGVFYGSALESVELPPTLRVIGNYAFGECQSLREVRLPDGIERIDERCFSGSGLETISIPSSVKRIETATFVQCKDLKRVELSEGLERIGVSAFNDSGLESVRLPSSVRWVGAFAFRGCR